MAINKINVIEVKDGDKLDQVKYNRDIQSIVDKNNEIIDQINVIDTAEWENQQTQQQQHIQEIEANRQAIEAGAQNIEANRLGLEINTQNIASNTQEIDTIKNGEHIVPQETLDAITANTQNIASNTQNIETNTQEIDTIKNGEHIVPHETLDAIAENTEKLTNFEAITAGVGEDKTYEAVRVLNNSQQEMMRLYYIQNYIEFFSAVKVPTPTEDMHASTKKYVDDTVANSEITQHITDKILRTFAEEGEGENQSEININVARKLQSLETAEGGAGGELPWIDIEYRLFNGTPEENIALFNELKGLPVGTAILFGVWDETSGNIPGRRMGLISYISESHLVIRSFTTQTDAGQHVVGSGHFGEDRATLRNTGVIEYLENIAIEFQYVSAERVSTASLETDYFSIYSSGGPNIKWEPQAAKDFLFQNVEGGYSALQEIGKIDFLTNAFTWNKEPEADNELVRKIDLDNAVAGLAGNDEHPDYSGITMASFLYGSGNLWPKLNTLSLDTQTITTGTPNYKVLEKEHSFEILFNASADQGGGRRGDITGPDEYGVGFVLTLNLPEHLQGKEFKVLEWSSTVGQSEHSASFPETLILPEHITLYKQGAFLTVAGQLFTGLESPDGRTLEEHNPVLYGHIHDTNLYSPDTNADVSQHKNLKALVASAWYRLRLVVVN